ncbi:MAG: phasin family protein [Candidatus Zixiibacteriota bacterium]|nr:MAG: phasin family protein [candidate division Zixibacteria bacterium]
MKVIKRYKNRRLYDTETKEYITHDDLYRIVRSKVPFTIVDNKSNRDITLPVLGRLLVNEVKGWEDIKGSKEVLIEIISQGGKQSMSILRNTFLASVGIINLTRKKAEEVIDSLIKAGEISKSDRKKAVMELLDKAEETTLKMKDKVKKETGGIQKELNKVLDKVKKAADKMPQKKIMAELDRLNKKVDGLSKKIDEMS